jgi:hypothetical protein
LEVLASLPDDPWRQQQELEFQLAPQRVVAVTKGLSAREVGETIARARRLAKQID